MLPIQHIINDLVNGEYEKVASHTQSYSADAVINSLEKVASAGIDNKVNNLLKIAAVTIRRLSELNGNLEKQAKIRLIIEDMDQKGLVDGGEFGKKTAELLSKTPDELRIFEEAVKLASGMNGGSNHFEGDAEPLSGRIRVKNMFDDVLNINQ